MAKASVAHFSTGGVPATFAEQLSDATGAGVGTAAGVSTPMRRLPSRRLGRLSGCKWITKERKRT